MKKIVNLIKVKNNDSFKMEDVVGLKKAYVKYDEMSFVNGGDKLLMLDCNRNKTDLVLIEMQPKKRDERMFKLLNNYREEVEFYLLFKDDRIEDFIDLGKVIEIKNTKKNIFNL